MAEDLAGEFSLRPLLDRAGLMQGQTAWPPLTSEGVGQAIAVADELEQYRAGRIVSSDLRRASETARIIGDRLALPIAHTPLLRERCWGIYEGAPVVEGHRADCLLTDEDALPQGESRTDVATRLRTLLSSLLVSPDPVVVVTHGDVIREAVRLWTPYAADAGRLENGCIVAISAHLESAEQATLHQRGTSVTPSCS